MIRTYKWVWFWWRINYSFLVHPVSEMLSALLSGMGFWKFKDIHFSHKSKFNIWVPCKIFHFITYYYVQIFGRFLQRSNNSIIINSPHHSSNVIRILIPFANFLPKITINLSWNDFSVTFDFYNMKSKIF